MADESVALAAEPTAQQPNPEPLLRVYKFTTEQLAKFFGEKWQNVICEICKQDDWTYDATNSFVSIPVTNGINNGVPSALINVALRVHCTSCGNMKFLLAPVIQHWLEHNP